MPLAYNYATVLAAAEPRFLGRNHSSVWINFCSVRTLDKTSAAPEQPSRRIRLMKRVFTATCLAATFAVGLAAQSTGTSGSAQDPQQGGQGRGGPRTVTGCLRAGDTAGTYMLTDVQMQG